MSERYDLAVIGAGIAGLSAAMFGARLGLRTVLVDRLGLGGELVNAGALDSYPGLAEGVSGAEMVGRLSEQALAMEVEPELAEATRLVASGNSFVVETEARACEAGAVVLATGGSPRRLGVPGEEEYTGRGVSHCAVCDGSFFSAQDVVVAGGGDAALYSALYLAGLCRSVTVAFRGSEPRAAAFLRKRVAGKANVGLQPRTTIAAIRGATAVESIVLRAGDGAETPRPASAVFVCIGLEPRSELVRGTIGLDATGRAIVDLGMATSRPGLFAAGSVRAGSPEQIVTAAADGATAAWSAFRFLKERRTA